MRSKKTIVIVSVGAAVLIATGTAGAFYWNSQELARTIQGHANVTLSTVNPTAYTVSVKGTQSVNSNWVQLDQLKTYSKFRQEFDKQLNINIITVNGINGKSGCLYVDSSNTQSGNTTISDAFRNQTFVEKYWNNTDIQHSIMKLAPDAYSDVKGNDNNSLMASLNAYYNLLGDSSDPTCFNPTQSVSRCEFLSMLYKAITPVYTEYSAGVTANDTFMKSVGFNTTDALFARQLKDAGFLKFSDGSLNGYNIKTSMTRAEAVYLVMQEYFHSDYEAFDADASSGFNDMKDGGNLAGDGEGQSQWELYTLAYMMDHPDKGMQTELYKAMALANKLGVLKADADGKSRWQEPISKSEAMQLVVNANLALDKEKGYLSTVPYGTNSATKYSIVNGSYHIYGDQMMINPQYDAEGLYVYGVSPTGGAMTIPYDKLPVDEQLIVRQMHNELEETKKKEAVEQAEKDQVAKEQAAKEQAEKDKNKSSNSSGSTQGNTSGSTKGNGGSGESSGKGSGNSGNNGGSNYNAAKDPFANSPTTAEPATKGGTWSTNNDDPNIFS